MRLRKKILISAIMIPICYLIAVGFCWIMTLGQGNYWWHPFEFAALMLLIMPNLMDNKWWKNTILILCDIALMIAGFFYYVVGFDYHPYDCGYYSYCHEENEYTYLYYGSWIVWALLMVWVGRDYYRGLNNTTLFGSFLKDRALFEKRRKWCRWVDEYKSISTVPISMISISGDSVAEYYRKRAGLPANDPYYLENRNYVMTSYYNPPPSSDDDEPSGPGFLGHAAMLFYILTKK